MATKRPLHSHVWPSAGESRLAAPVNDHFCNVFLVTHKLSGRILAMCLKVASDLPARGRLVAIAIGHCYSPDFPYW